MHLSVQRILGGFANDRYSDLRLRRAADRYSRLQLDRGAYSQPTPLAATLTGIMPPRSDKSFCTKLRLPKNR